MRFVRESKAAAVLHTGVGTAHGALRQLTLLCWLPFLGRAAATGPPPSVSLRSEPVSVQAQVKGTSSFCRSHILVAGDSERQMLVLVCPHGFLFFLMGSSLFLLSPTSHPVFLPNRWPCQPTMTSSS